MSNIGHKCLLIAGHTIVVPRSSSASLPITSVTLGDREGITGQGSLCSSGHSSASTQCVRAGAKAPSLDGAEKAVRIRWRQRKDSQGDTAHLYTSELEQTSKRWLSLIFWGKRYHFSFLCIEAAAFSKTKGTLTYCLLGERDFEVGNGLSWSG